MLDSADVQHDFVGTKGAELGLLSPEYAAKRCKHCGRSEDSAVKGYCPVRELVRDGYITLGRFNPDGLERFLGRKCVTCGQEIMGHWLVAADRRGTYWCDRDGTRECGGITDCAYEMEGIEAPRERTK